MSRLYYIIQYFFGEKQQKPSENQVKSSKDQLMHKREVIILREQAVHKIDPRMAGQGAQTVPSGLFLFIFQLFLSVVGNVGLSVFLLLLTDFLYLRAKLDPGKLRLTIQ